MTFTIQPRTLSFLRDFSSLEDAISWGLSNGKPFDVSVNSGAIVWAWEQRS